MEISEDTEKVRVPAAIAISIPRILDSFTVYSPITLSPVFTLAVSSAGNYSSVILASTSIPSVLLSSSVATIPTVVPQLFKIPRWEVGHPDLKVGDLCLLH